MASNSDHDIVLFVKAGSDRECLGCCPFSQRLFMVLWLKGTQVSQFKLITQNTLIILFINDSSSMWQLWIKRLNRKNWLTSRLEQTRHSFFLTVKYWPTFQELKSSSNPPSLLQSELIQFFLFYEFFRYPSLSPVHPESYLAGNDLFAKFSAWIKCKPDQPNQASKKAGSYFNQSAGFG